MCDRQEMGMSNTTARTCGQMQAERWGLVVIMGAQSGGVVGDLEVLRSWGGRVCGWC